MYWRALLMQPAVLAALTSAVLGGPKQHAAPTWLHRVGVALGVLATIAGLASGWIWLTKTYPLEEAALYFSLATALLAAFCIAFPYAWTTYKGWRVGKWKKNMIEKVENTANFALNELETFGRDYPKTSAALLALAGYLVANRAAAGTDKVLEALEHMISNLKGNEDNE